MAFISRDEEKVKYLLINGNHKELIDKLKCLVALEQVIENLKTKRQEESRFSSKKDNKEQPFRTQDQQRMEVDSKRGHSQRMSGEKGGEGFGN